jgi:hypothetical protein
VNYPIVSISKASKDWLQAEKPSRVLHVFEISCNLINESGDIFSLVGTTIRNGPFSAVLMSDDFTGAIDISDEVHVENSILKVGILSFDAKNALAWNASVDWTKLHVKKDKLISSLALIEELINRYAPSGNFAELVLAIPRKYDPKDAIFQKAEVAISELFDGLVAKNIMAMRNGAKSLAGLGIGLTPAGDDFMLGVMLALFATQTKGKAEEISTILADESMPLTNSISAAWLNASASGKAGQSWHDLVAAIAEDQGERLAEAVMRILPTGHTSGADALGGFVATIRLLAEKGMAA